MMASNEERERVNAIKTFINTLGLNGCIEIKKYAISASEVRLNESVLNCYNYEEFNNNVLVPMTQDDYGQLTQMFGVPFRSVDASVSGYMVNMHMEQARLVHNLAESSFEWKFFYAMVHHWFGLSHLVGKKRYTYGFMRLVHRGVKNFVTLEYKRGYDCGIHGRGCAIKGVRTVGFDVDGENWCNWFCCKALKFLARKDGQTLFQKFVRFIEGKQLTRKDAYLQILPKYEGGQVVAGPWLTGKESGSGFDENVDKLRVMFAEHPRFPKVWNARQNVLFENMKRDLTSVGVYLVVAKDMKVEVWSWPVYWNAEKKSGEPQAKKQKSGSGTIGTIEVRKCMCYSFNSWVDLWAEVKEGLCLNIRKKHFLRGNNVEVVQVTTNNVGNVVAMSETVVGHETQGHSYVLQIVNRDLDNAMERKVEGYIDAETMANLYGGEACECEQAVERCACVSKWEAKREKLLALARRRSQLRREEKKKKKKAGKNTENTSNVPGDRNAEGAKFNAGEGETSLVTYDPENSSSESGNFDFMLANDEAVLDPDDNVMLEMTLKGSDSE